MEVVKDWLGDVGTLPDIRISSNRPTKNANGYTILFNGGGRKFKNGSDVNEVVVSKSGQVVSGVYQQPTPNKNPGHLLGWFLKDGSELQVLQNGTIIANKDVEVYPKYVYKYKYAVSIYGICKERSANQTWVSGITFGGALGDYHIGEDGSVGYVSHKATGETENGNSHRCVHEDDWATIINWNKDDPYVYEQCISNNCTHSVELNIPDTLSTGELEEPEYDGDGPSVLFRELMEGDSWGNTKFRYSGSGGYSHTGQSKMLSDELVQAFPDLIQDNLVNCTIIGVSYSINTWDYFYTKLSIPSPTTLNYPSLNQEGVIFDNKFTVKDRPIGDSKNSYRDILSYGMKNSTTAEKIPTCTRRGARNGSVYVLSNGKPLRVTNDSVEYGVSPMFTLNRN